MLKNKHPHELRDKIKKDIYFSHSWVCEVVVILLGLTERVLDWLKDEAGLILPHTCLYSGTSSYIEQLSLIAEGGSPEGQDIIQTHSKPVHDIFAHIPLAIKYKVQNPCQW